MIEEDVFYWQIVWAGRWMTTTTRFTEAAIKREHPEAIRIDDSQQISFTPETPQERSLATSMRHKVHPDVSYNLHARF